MQVIGTLRLGNVRSLSIVNILKRCGKEVSHSLPPRNKHDSYTAIVRGIIHCPGLVAAGDLLVDLLVDGVVDAAVG